MLETFLYQIRDYLQLLSNMKLADIADIAIIAFLIYKLVGIVKRTSTWRAAWGIIITFLALWLSGVLRLNAVNYVLRTTMQVGLLALVILFQPELRRMFERVGASRISLFIGKETDMTSVASAITQTLLSCMEMSRSKIGALIIFERKTSLFEVMNSGTLINADVTGELLKNIFFPKAPLHDGAVLIRDCRVVAAGCVLPLSANQNLSRELGMRHRAALGVSEQSDAVVVIVSEETGAISIAIDGMLKRHLDRDTFEAILRKELIPAADKTPRGLRRIFKGNKNGNKKSSG